LFGDDPVGGVSIFGSSNPTNKRKTQTLFGDEEDETAQEQPKRIETKSKKSGAPSLFNEDDDPTVTIFAKIAKTTAPTTTKSNPLFTENEPKPILTTDEQKTPASKKEPKKEEKKVSSVFDEQPTITQTKKKQTSLLFGDDEPQPIVKQITQTVKEPETIKPKQLETPQVVPEKAKEAPKTPKESTVTKPEPDKTPEKSLEKPKEEKPAEKKTKKAGTKTAAKKEPQKVDPNLDIFADIISTPAQSTDTKKKLLKRRLQKRVKVK